MKDSDRTYPGGVSKYVFWLFVACWWAISILFREQKRYNIKPPE